MNRFESQIEDEYPCSSASSGVATLLIPAAFDWFIQEQLTSRNWTMAVFLRVLVQKYRAILVTRPPRSARPGCQRQYQRSGLNLHKRSFRPEADIWAELSMIAHYMGVSRCYLFALLIRFEISGDSTVEELSSDRINKYDIDFPDRIEMREILYFRQGFARKILLLKPVPPWKMRIDLWPFPPPLEWLRAKLREPGKDFR